MDDIANFIAMNCQSISNNSQNLKKMINLIALVNSAGIIFFNKVKVQILNQHYFMNVYPFESRINETFEDKKKK